MRDRSPAVAKRSLPSVHCKRPLHASIARVHWWSAIDVHTQPGAFSIRLFALSEYQLGW